MHLKILGLSLVSGIACSALAQSSSVTTPLVYGWAAPNIHSGWPGTSTNGYKLKSITPFVHIDLNDELYDPSTQSTYILGSRPAEAGARAANRAIALRAITGSSSTMPIAIVVKEFGKDGLPPSGVNADDAKRYFFQPSDVLSGSESWSWPDNGDSVTKRGYLHPFITNATASNPPMKQWFAAFLDGYRDVTNAPKPEAILFDLEVNLAPSAGPNPVFFLKQLKDTDFWDSKDGNGNPVYPVPGQDPSKTLKALCKDASVVIGLGDNLIDHIIPTSAAVDRQDNLEAMPFWYSLMQGVRDATLEKCVYSLVNDSAHGWAPQTGVPLIHCGNYDDLNTDGVMDTTGWFVDRATGSTLALANADPRAGTRNWNQLPRVDADRAWGAPLYYLANDRRWFGLQKRASGDLDCPVLYELDAGALEGFGDRPGFSQQKLFRNAGGSMPAESPWDSAVRVSRHTMESAINSFEGQRHARMAPWIEMPSTTFDGQGNQTPTSGFRTVQEIAEMVAMVRAKKSPKIQYFWRTDSVELTGTELQEAIDLAWEEGASVVNRVYATKVSSYLRRDASFGQTQPTPIPDDLEYTLRNSEDKEDVVSLDGLFQVGLSSPTWAEQLVVDFTWSNDYVAMILDGTAALHDVGLPNTMHVNVEYATSNPDAVARVFLFHQKHMVGSQEVAERWVESSGASFIVNSSLLENGMYMNRISIDVPCDIDDMPGVIWDEHPTSAPHVYKSKVMIQQGLDAWDTMETDVNLVQLYPDFLPSAIGDLDYFSISDLNFDGTVDSRDVEIFWVAEEDESPLADLNNDGFIDQTDYELFVSGM